MDDTVSRGSRLALVVYDFFYLNYLLAPLGFGALLGLAIGGLAQRPGRVGAIAAGLVLLGIVGCLAWFRVSLHGMGQERQGYAGMALMAFIGVGIAGYTLLVAALWAGIGVTGAAFKSA